MNQDEKVWGVCRRIKEQCSKCPREEQTPYGLGTRACYAQAEEVCQFIEHLAAIDRSRTAESIMRSPEGP